MEAVVAWLSRIPRRFPEQRHCGLHSSRPPLLAQWASTLLLLLRSSLFPSFSFRCRDPLHLLWATAQLILMPLLPVWRHNTLTNSSRFSCITSLVPVLGLGLGLVPEPPQFRLLFLFLFLFLSFLLPRMLSIGSLQCWFSSPHRPGLLLGFTMENCSSKVSSSCTS